MAKKPGKPAVAKDLRVKADPELIEALRRLDPDRKERAEALRRLEQSFKESRGPPITAAERALLNPLWKRPPSLVEPAANDPAPRAGVQPAPETEQPVDKGGNPGHWNWLGLKPTLEKQRARRAVTFKNRKAFKDWIAQNVRPMNETGEDPPPPDNTTINRAIKKHKLDVLLGFSETSRKA
jgi:hypothetical protein